MSSRTLSWLSPPAWGGLRATPSILRRAAAAPAARRLPAALRAAAAAALPFAVWALLWGFFLLGVAGPAARLHG